ncbi:MAG: PilZ domain-containing protein [Hydrogenovibrio sp.]|nr:PilZ domain-containing protein [Hydrogenovibrio sp.]
MLFNAPSTRVDRDVVIKGQTVSVRGTLKELSIAGVGVESPKKASPGTRIEVIFEIPAKGYFRELEIAGFIRHVHNTHSGFYLTLEFESISEQQKEYIEDFIDYKKRLRELGKRTHHAENG